MDFGKFISIIKNGVKDKSDKCNTFAVKYKDGKVKKADFFVADNGNICMKKNARAHYGFVVGWDTTEKIASIKVKEPFKPTIVLVRKRVKSAIDMLKKSQLWGRIKNEMEAFLKLSDSEIAQFIKDVQTDEYNMFWDNQRGLYGFIERCDRPLFENFIKERCFTSIPFTTYSRERLTNELADAIRNKRDYSYRWTNGYDNSIDLCFSEEDGNRGWLSMEYIGCGNGHYYLLLDETHALFSEDD